jgi:hypothetical protein
MSSKVSPRIPDLASLLFFELEILKWETVNAVVQDNVNEINDMLVWIEPSKSLNFP